MKLVHIQRSRQKKQVSPNGLEVVYVGRGSKYGNPFKLGEKLMNIIYLFLTEKMPTNILIIKTHLQEKMHFIYLKNINLLN